jgi:hypothetical protein
LFRIRAALTLAALLETAAGCDPGLVGPGLAEGARLRVHVTGGLAVADYTYEVAGRAVVGVECRSLCQFASGDTLLALTPAVLVMLDEEVQAAGLDDLSKDADYGTECCDQRTYEITWTSGDAKRTLVGSDGTLPEKVRELVRVLELLRRSIAPVIVSQTGSLVGHPADLLQIVSARVEGGVLDVEVRYGGGCAAHDVDAVAWTEWMESNPVQVGVALTHDAHGDACKALVTRSLHFDLDPLRRAYQRTYGTGSSTMNLRVEAASGGSTLLVPYSF